MGAAGLAQQSIELRVSATVPPPPCEYPERCEPAPKRTKTRVLVDGQSVRYVGFTPEIRKEGGLLKVNF